MKARKYLNIALIIFITGLVISMGNILTGFHNLWVSNGVFVLDIIGFWFLHKGSKLNKQ